jgi:glycosyl transferase family 87
VRSFIEQRLNQAYIRRIAILVLAIYVFVLTVSFATAKGGRTVFGPFLGADFGAFYVAGKIFNEYGPENIYDVSLHQRLYKETFPTAPPGEELSYANAPFFVAPFILLSRLPYAWAYFLWLVISVSLFVAGFSILWRALPSLPNDLRLTGLLLALSFWPFLVECLAGGQTSAFGFFWLALVIACEGRNRFWSGVALAFCAYKPTLLFLVVPMLVISGRWLSVIGLAGGNLVLGLISLALVGRQGCINFINRLLFYSKAATGREAGLRSWKYVDINAFMRLLLPHQTHVRWAITAVFVLSVVPFIVWAWWRLRRESHWRSLWALTLTWTPVLNIYMGIYDSTILVLAVLILSAEFYRSKTHALPFSYRCFLIALYLSPWFTQNIALLTHVQIYTVVVAAFGIYQLRAVRAGELEFSN